MPLTSCEVDFYSRVPHHLINIYEKLSEQNRLAKEMNEELSRIADALERLADKGEENTLDED